LSAVPADQLPLGTLDQQAYKDLLSKIFFDPKFAPKRTNKKDNEDLVLTSSVNFYENLTQKEVEQYYKSLTDPKDLTPVSYGLNSKLIKNAQGQIEEKVWKIGGMYSKSIEQIVFWIEKALSVAENDAQKEALQLLISYYKTGDLKTFDQYNIAWVKDTTSSVDFISGFIEVYADPLGLKGHFESIVQIKDPIASKRIEKISSYAQWFEDNSPIDSKHKKANVKGISARVINVAMEAGDAAPSTPIGINLPNANWIRETHGSKSVNLANIVNAYNAAGGSSSLNEFCYTKEEIDSAVKHSELAGMLHTDMHEVIGHASGKLNPGVKGDALGNYASTLEEARADLVALYYVMDQKLVDIGIMPSLEVGMAEYDGYIRNGLMLQLRRIKPGEDIEEDHMRNRQLVAMWCYEKGKKDNVIEKKTKDNKTYFVINDYKKLQTLFGDLLKEIQRIKSEGDFKAGKALVENYGVKVDKNLHKEVLERFASLNSPAYRVFVQPNILADPSETKIIVQYPRNFLEQMLDYGKKYGFLPVEN